MSAAAQAASGGLETAALATATPESFVNPAVAGAGAGATKIFNVDITADLNGFRRMSDVATFVEDLERSVDLVGAPSGGSQ